MPRTTIRAGIAEVRSNAKIQNSAGSGAPRTRRPGGGRKSIKHSDNAEMKHICQKLGFWLTHYMGDPAIKTAIDL
jgi:hypothetical protein